MPTDWTALWQTLTVAAIDAFERDDISTADLLLDRRREVMEAAKPQLMKSEHLAALQSLDQRLSQSAADSRARTAHELRRIAESRRAASLYNS